MKFATLVLRTSNEKLRGCACTYGLLETCPESCPWHPEGGYHGGCYARMSRVSIHLRRVEAQLAGRDPIETMCGEVELAARDARGDVRGTALRWNVSGNTRDERDARRMAQGDAAWREAGGGPTWIYDHRWPEIPREAWGGIAVFASCERVSQLSLARERGYRAALVCADATATKRKLAHLGIKAISCKHESRGTPCAACGVCWDAAPHKPVVLFTTHGSAVGAKLAAMTMAAIDREEASR